MTEDFIDHFARLPANVQAQARKQYGLWRSNPGHPSLHFKRVHAKERIYAVRIGLGWRALGLLEDDAMTWFWIGSHAEYDRLLRGYRH